MRASDSKPRVLPMKQMTVRELRGALRQIDKLLAESGEIVLTRHGKPIARLLPARTLDQMPSHADFRQRMPRVNVSSGHLIRQERDDR